MKTTTKIIGILASVVVGCVCVFAGCGEEKGVDWSKMKYPDYVSLYAEETAPEGTEGYWDYWETKPIAWQFKNEKHAENHGFANFFPTLMNFYEDGSVKAWQRCTLIPSMFDYMPGDTEAQDAYNKEYKLLELFFGYWALDKTANTMKLYAQGSADYASDGAEIQYAEYEFSMTPTDGKISFFFNVTEKGQAIRSYMSCDTAFEGTVQYSSYANFAQGITVDKEEA